jgi:hypothetical protein
VNARVERARRSPQAVNRERGRDIRRTCQSLGIEQRQGQKGR